MNSGRHWRGEGRDWWQSSYSHTSNGGGRKEADKEADWRLIVKAVHQTAFNPIT